MSGTRSKLTREGFDRTVLPVPLGGTTRLVTAIDEQKLLVFNTTATVTVTIDPTTLTIGSEVQVMNQGGGEVNINVINGTLLGYPALINPLSSMQLLIGDNGIVATTEIQGVSGGDYNNVSATGVETSVGFDFITGKEIFQRTLENATDGAIIFTNLYDIVAWEGRVGDTALSVPIPLNKAADNVRFGYEAGLGKYEHRYTLTNFPINNNRYMLRYTKRDSASDMWITNPLVTANLLFDTPFAYTIVSDVIAPTTNVQWTVDGVAETVTQDKTGNVTVATSGRPAGQYILSAYINYGLPSEQEIINPLLVNFS